MTTSMHTRHVCAKTYPPPVRRHPRRLASRAKLHAVFFGGSLGQLDACLRRHFRTWSWRFLL